MCNTHLHNNNFLKPFVVSRHINGFPLLTFSCVCSSCLCLLSFSFFSPSLPSVVPAVSLPVSLLLFPSPRGFLQPLIQADGEWQAKRTSLRCRIQGTSHNFSLSLLLSLSLFVIHSSIDGVTHSDLHFLSLSHNHIVLLLTTISLCMCPCVYLCVCVSCLRCHRHTGGTELIVSQGDTGLTAV